MKRLIRCLLNVTVFSAWASRALQRCWLYSRCNVCLAGIEGRQGAVGAPSMHWQPGFWRSGSFSLRTAAPNATETQRAARQAQAWKTFSGGTGV